MSYKVAVVGATGNVGREILSTLAQREFPISDIIALASQDSIGKEVSFGEDTILQIQNLQDFDFEGVDFVFSSAGSSVAQEFAPRAARTGCIIIDNSSAFRMNPDVPLVVPEVNADSLEHFRNRNIISNPNCVAIPLTLVLKPLHDIAPIKRVVVSSYQSTSGAGQKAMDELFRQTRSIFMNSSVVKEEFPHQIAFNVFPHIGAFESDGFTGEERKVMDETKKILDPYIEVFATCVRVPVFIGHSLSVALEFESPLSESQAKQILKDAPGIEVLDNRKEESYVTPIDCVGEDSVFVSRIREDPSVPYGLGLWIVSDNLRKGAALNSVQIAETLIESYL